MPTTNEPNVPSYGYRSYAELIKQRLVHGRFYAGWSVRQGRYDFRVMYFTGRGDSYDSRYPIGYEMVQHTRTPRRDVVSNDWIMRVYHDGTALWRPHKLGWLRYSTMEPINRIVDYFFYKEAELPDSTDDYARIQVLRRKALNPYHLTPTATGFGEFLTSKYNKGVSQ
jgi:hypothetical protein